MSRKLKSPMHRDRQVGEVVVWRSLVSGDERGSLGARHKRWWRGCVCVCGLLCLAVGVMLELGLEGVDWFNYLPALRSRHDLSKNAAGVAPTPTRMQAWG